MPPATVNLVRIPGLSFTLLEFAAHNGQLEVVEALLSFGADVNIQTPCLWAASNGHIHVIEILTQHGALPSRERGLDGVSRTLCSHTTSALHARYTSMQSTPLHYAALDSHFETVQYLVKKGCSVLAIDDRGETTIDAAKVRHDTSAVRVIGIRSCFCRSASIFSVQVLQ